MPTLLIFLIFLVAAMATVGGFLGAAVGASWGRGDDSLAAPLSSTGMAIAYVLGTSFFFYLFATNRVPVGTQFPAMAALAGAGLIAGNTLALVFGMARPMLMGAGAGLAIGIVGEFLAMIAVVAQTTPLVLVLPITLIPVLTGAAVAFALERIRVPEPWQLVPTPTTAVAADPGSEAVS